MDPALLKEREAFLKRSKANFSVEAPRPPTGSLSRDSSASASTPRLSISSTSSSTNLPLSSSSADLWSYDRGGRPITQGRFAILSRIVKYMKQRHLERERHALSVDEILEEAMMQGIPRDTVKWLEEEALPNNPKIRMNSDKKFVFKPRYDLRNRQDLIQLLKRHDQAGLGSIPLDDIAEALPDAEKAVNHFGDQIIRIVTPHDKKVILFYNDKSYDLNVDEAFKQQWRSVSVEGLQESKIEEYLNRNGIASMSGDRKAFVPFSRNQKRRRGKLGLNRPVHLKDNYHLKDVLIDYAKDSSKTGPNPATTTTNNSASNSGGQPRSSTPGGGC